MKQVFHHFDLWEEHHAGLWRLTYGVERDRFLSEAIIFTGNAKLYGSFMMRVIREWPYSCEQNLSNMSINRQAWVGHAACCLAINCPEDITRLAWHTLTQKQQDDANAEADHAILTWERSYIQKLRLKCQRDQLELTF